MSKEYSWRDGWALSYPHPLPEQPKQVYRETIFRCTCTGNYVEINRQCSLCGQTMKGSA